MGRPLNKRYFGDPATDGDQFAVQFHNGTAVVAGWIDSQKGSKRFRCTDGTATAVCTLVETATNEGEMTLTLQDVGETPAVGIVTKITGRRATLTDGSVVSWGAENVEAVVLATSTKAEKSIVDKITDTFKQETKVEEPKPKAYTPKAKSATKTTAKKAPAKSTTSTTRKTTTRKAPVKKDSSE